MRVLLATLCLASPLLAAEADPLALVPRQADLVVKVEKPKELLVQFYGNQAFRQLQRFEAFQEAIGSSDSRLFFQLVAYFEKELGARWPELVDRLAGGGMAAATKFGPQPAPSLLVIQARDPELLGKFWKLGVDLLDKELTRTEAKDRLERGSRQGIETIRVGKDLHAARAGASLLISNNEKALELALDLHAGKGESVVALESLKEARARCNPQAKAWAWLNFETVKGNPDVAKLLGLPRDEPVLTVLFGGWLDVARRSSFLAADLVTRDDGFTVNIRVPAGREGMTDDLALHLPPADAKGETQGTLPLLEPKGVLYSSSWYLDLPRIWTDRSKLFHEQQVKSLESFNKNSGRFLLANQLEEVLTGAGPHQRLVVAHQEKLGYAIEPSQRFPAVALVTDMAKPDEFARSMDTLLRAAALAAGFQYKLKMTEEKLGDATLVCYRFPEDAKNQGDAAGNRFNFSPCFARVGGQFLMASTQDLGRELVGILQKEAEKPPKLSKAASRSRWHSAGAADLLASIEEQLVIQGMLAQSLSPEQASQETRAFLGLLRGLGTLKTETFYEPRDFRYEIRFIHK